MNMIEQPLTKDDKTKIEVLTHYGNGKLQCLECSESRLNCLTLDHINNDGIEDRKKKGAGKTLYRKLKREGYPNGYQNSLLQLQS